MSISSPISQIKRSYACLAPIYCYTFNCWNTHPGNLLTEKISREMKTFESGCIQNHFFVAKHCAPVVR
jgi:hypothetical protein